MSDSDDDMPPPLEDMSDKLEAIQKLRNMGLPEKEEEVVETRLGGGKPA